MRVVAERMVQVGSGLMAKLVLEVEQVEVVESELDKQVGEVRQKEKLG